MKNTKYHIYLNSEERCLLISSLNDLRNRLIAEGKYTDSNPLLQSRINIDFLKVTFSTIMEDKDYDK